MKMVTHRSGGLAFLALVMLLGACESDDPNNPEYWIKQLKSTRRSEAIKQLGRMAEAGGEKGKLARTSIPKMIQLYEADKERGEIIPALIQMKATGPEVEKVLATAITDMNESSSAAAAADYVGDMGAKGLIRNLVNVLDSQMEDEVKAASLRSLLKFKDPSTVDDLVRILDRSVDKQWIHLNALACRALGEIGPPAASKALPSLVRGIFLRDKFSRMSFRDCAVALIRFGDDAGKALTDAIQGKDKELTEWSAKQGHVRGLIVEEAAKVIGLLGYAPASDALSAQLVVRNDPPPSYDEKKAQIWAIIEAQRFQNVIEALGRIRSPNAIEPLGKWLYQGEYLRRIRVPFAINFIGAPEGLPVLARCAERATVDSLGWFRLDCARFAGHLARPEDIGTLERLIPIAEKLRKELEEYRATDKVTANDFLAKLDGFKLQVAALKECGKDVACWVKKVDGKNTHVRDQAIWQLSRLAPGNEKAISELLSRVGSANFALRNGVLDALPGVCTKKTCYDAIAKVRKSESGKARYKGFQDRMLFVMTQIASK